MTARLRVGNGPGKCLIMNASLSEPGERLNVRHWSDVGESIRPLVCAGEERGWYGEAERLRSLEVDDHLVLSGCLHRQFSRPLPLKDTIDIPCGTPVLIDNVRPVGEQAAVFGKKRLE